MNFPDIPHPDWPVTYVTSDAIIYRADPNTGMVLEILTGVRQDVPWKGATTVCFGGFVDPTDVDVHSAMRREIREETGLDVQATGLVGVYGPARSHYTLHEKRHQLCAMPTDVNATTRPIVNFVFATEVEHGTLLDSDEQRCLRWVRPRSLVGETITFDHAKVLVDFVKHVYQRRSGFNYQADTHLSVFR